MPATREACLVLVAGLCLGGCGDGGGEPGLGQIRIVSGLAQTDATGTVLEDPLVVEVHGQGEVPPKASRFGSVPPSACPPARYPFLLTWVVSSPTWRLPPTRAAGLPPGSI